MATTKKKKPSKFIIIALAAGFVLVAAVLGLLYQNHQSGLPTGESVASNERAYRSWEVDGERYQYNTDLITMVFLGIDTQDGQERGQADAIYLVVLDRGEKKLRVIAASRDSMIPIRMFDAGGRDLGWERQHLALAYSYGSSADRGCLLVGEALSRLLNGIPIVYYASVNLSQIPEIQNLVGELEVVVPDDSLAYLGKGYKEGETVVVSADNVEEFVRSRNTEEDFSNSGRMERQKAYIEAYIAKLKQLLENDFSGTLKKMTNLLQSARSNISLSEVSDFAEMFLEYEFTDEDFYRIEGENQAGMFHDEYIVDEAAVKQLVIKIFYKKES